MDAQQGLAVMGLVACAAVWAGMAAGPARRRRMKEIWLKRWLALRLGLHSAWQRLRHPAQARQARRDAEEVITRARRQAQVDREGNVYRPDAFNKRPGRDKLH